MNESEKEILGRMDYLSNLDENEKDFAKYKKKEDESIDRIMKKRTDLLRMQKLKEELLYDLVDMLILNETATNIKNKTKITLVVEKVRLFGCNTTTKFTFFSEKHVLVVHAQICSAIFNKFLKNDFSEFNISKCYAFDKKNLGKSVIFPDFLYDKRLHGISLILEETTTE